MTRLHKFSDQIRDVISTQLSGGRMNDPRLQNVSVTAVKISADLGAAIIYFRNYSELPNQDVIDGFYSAKGYLKTKIARYCSSKRIPDLRFKFDQSIEEGSKIESMLREIYN